MSENAPDVRDIRGAEKTAGRAGLQGDSTATFHVAHASAEPLLSRLDGVQRVGNGWRARCPACGGRSRKLSIAECDGRTLVHCFAGCAPVDVLAAVGLTLPDLFPTRLAPQTPSEREQARRHAREAGWSSALGVLGAEATVVHAAAGMIARGEPLTADDIERVRVAAGRIGSARLVLQ